MELNEMKKMKAERDQGLEEGKSDERHNILDLE